MERKPVFSASIKEAQQRFADPERAARIIHAMPDTHRLTDEQRLFLAGLPFFFIATAGSEGRLQCNFKGGGPGILFAPDENNLFYPEFPGNDLMLSVGNMLDNPHIGLLALSFEDQQRLKVNGRVSIEDAETHPLAGRWPGARLIVHIHIDQVIRNCSRRIPRLIQGE